MVDQMRSELLPRWDPARRLHTYGDRGGPCGFDLLTSKVPALEDIRFGPRHNMTLQSS